MRGQGNQRSKGFALGLRKEMTDAERKLWQHLRREQLGAKFRRQHPFEDYILDFVSLRHRLVIEVDGGQHFDNIDADAARTAVLESAGFRVLRFWNNEVLMQTDAVLERIAAEIRALSNDPSPSQPSP